MLTTWSYDVPVHVATQLVTSRPAVIHLALVFEELLVSDNQSNKSPPVSMAALKLLAVNAISLQLTFAHEDVDTLLVVASTGNPVVDHAGSQLFQSGSGGVSGLPLESHP